MESKISAEFLQNVKETKRTFPEKEIPIIITYEPNVSGANIPSLLENVGFKVENRVPEINFVSGKITADSFEKLLEVAGIKKVEPDSKVYALGQ
jgi:hypothetical protein